MARLISCFILSVMIASCNRNKQNTEEHKPPIPYKPIYYNAIEQILVPCGYERIPLESRSFGQWLRNVRLKKNSRIYLYNGRLRQDQVTQFAVLDMPLGNTDLQQCADAILRLRAEYFFKQNNPDSIHFRATDGTTLSFARWLKGERHLLACNKLVPYMSSGSAIDEENQLEQFLEVVFSYCGTISLDKETRSVYDFKDVQPGDVLVMPGSPGHAMIVTDVAMNQAGEKIFMLAQGLMPAQDVHIVKNPTDKAISPWYRVGPDSKIITPQWIFYKNQLKRW